MYCKQLSENDKNVHYLEIIHIWNDLLVTELIFFNELGQILLSCKSLYEGKSISKLQVDIELKQIRVLIWKMLSFLNIISLYTEALVPSFHKPLKTSSIKFFGLPSEPSGDFRTEG
jgi:hypothetical protein